MSLNYPQEAPRVTSRHFPLGEPQVSKGDTSALMSMRLTPSPDRGSLLQKRKQPLLCILCEEAG